MAAFNAIKPGDVLWDCHMVKMGNTTMSRMACFQVKVISVDLDKRCAMCSWNYNPTQRWSEGRLKRLRRSPIKETK